MSAAEAPDVKNLLLQNDDEYRQLAEQHHHLDHRLHELTDKHYLSTSDQLEKVTLHKHYLSTSDQLEKNASSH